MYPGRSSLSNGPRQGRDRNPLLPLILGVLVVSVAAGHDYSLDFDAGDFTVKTLTVGDQTIACRAYEGIVYVARPVDTRCQSMNVYVPVEYYEGKSVGAYTAETAPIFLPNTVGGYMPGFPGSLDRGRGNRSNTLLVALSKGYVVASPGARGRTLQDAAGLYTGKAPACIVDLKAAVRYLRRNDKVIPGNAEKIVSNGTSAGGALSALLGATGNSADYAPYLKAIGAAEERDDIFAASCYCPITNLDHADAAYEWLFNGIHDYNGWGRKGTMTADQIEVSDRLKALFPAYVNGLGLKREDGTALTLDANGEGPFKDYVKSFVIASAQKALDDGKDLSGLTWITIEDGRVTDVDLDRFVAYATRMKSAPAFDSLDFRSPETNLFGTAAVNNQHFTAFARDNSTDHTLAEAAIVRMMNPMDYIGVEGVTTARYWRIRHGVVDRDTSLAIPVILTTRLRNGGCAVDFAMPWGQGHGGDYDLDELFAWIDGICREEQRHSIAPARDYPIQPVPFTAVQIDDSFWAPRIETNRAVTIPFALQKNEETGRNDNFRVAAGLKDGTYQGKRYNDTDVYKVIEGAAYSLTQHPDPKLETYIDGLVAIIAKAQEPDGYLFTARTCDPNHPADGAGPDRWSLLAVSHELYNVGHLYEAAVAYYQATGKRELLDVALKNADLIERTFGPDKRSGTPGHQEIEIGLVKLYRVTGDIKYLKLAQYFLDVRGRIEGYMPTYPEDSPWSVYNDPIQVQAHLPILEQTEAVGHAVRAMYMFAGIADVATLTGSEAYVRAIDRLWGDVVGRKLYVTGGIGALGSHESFGRAYELPNLTAYNETCAAIGNVFWNHRLFLLHGHAKYIDVLERTAYNGLISGLSLSGDRFFYPNPLSSDGRYPFNQGSTERAPWFGVACCPGNMTRFLPSFPGYIYATAGDTLYVNLFVAGRGRIDMGPGPVVVTQQTRYPWEGKIRIGVEPQTAGPFVVAVRIPGWARKEPVPGDLYRYLDDAAAAWQVQVNGRPVACDLQKGFARIERRWQAGDTIDVELPMPVRRVRAHDRVQADVNRIALERGPLVYCAEWRDQPGRGVMNLVLPDRTELTDRWQADVLNGVVTLTGRALAVQPDGTEVEQDFTAIPYYAWANRGSGQMVVWLPRNRQALEQIEVPPKD